MIKITERYGPYERVFSALENGDVFRYMNGLYLKVSTDIGHCGLMNAFSFDRQILADFTGNEIVELIDAELVITPLTKENM